MRCSLGGRLVTHIERKKEGVLPHITQGGPNSSYCLAASIFLVSSGTASNKSVWRRAGQKRRQNTGRDDRAEAEGQKGRTGNEADVGDLEDRRIGVLWRAI